MRSIGRTVVTLLTSELSNRASYDVRSGKIDLWTRFPALFAVLPVFPRLSRVSLSSASFTLCFRSIYFFFFFLHIFASIESLNLFYVVIWQVDRTPRAMHSQSLWIGITIFAMVFSILLFTDRYTRFYARKPRFKYRGLIFFLVVKKSFVPHPKSKTLNWNKKKNKINTKIHKTYFSERNKDKIIMIKCKF